MADGCEPLVERLLRETAAEARLSSQFRRRVMAAAENASRRRRCERRLLWTGCLLLSLFAGTLAWNHWARTWPPTPVSNSAEAPEAEARRPNSAGALRWRDVDAMIQRQRENSAAFRAARQ